MISHNLLQTLQKPFPTQGNTVLICLKGTHDYFSYRDFSSFATYILFGYYHWGNLFSLQSKIPMNENKETFENKSDLSSNKHYLSSSENEAWKKFRPVKDLNPWPLQYHCNSTNWVRANRELVVMLVTSKLGKW